MSVQITATTSFPFAFGYVVWFRLFHLIRSFCFFTDQFYLDRFGNLLVLILAVLFFPGFFRETEIKVIPIISHLHCNSFRRLRLPWFHQIYKR